jgi:NAD(P)-dependent dehydrogenase (short-subunit alcohol dehydrogenase family)
MTKGLFDCTGKVTLVTGGNGGIGLGFAMGCAKMGGDIAIWARNAEKNAAAKAELLAAGAGRVETYIVDVSDEQAIIDGYAELMKDFGRLDCVFANSGPPPRYDSVFDMPTQHWHDFQAVALHGAFFTLREGARLMKERALAGEPGGSLVACGSGSLYQGLAGKMEYAASKCGAEAVIRCLAVELGEYGIRANVVAPGLIITPMMGPNPDAADKALSAIYAPQTPMRRLGYGTDFEGIGAYLCSDASSFMSGETVFIDGGYKIRP